ncbi:MULTISPECIES: hypothetical protein [Bacillus]|uniref:hypothetical protein n=1 Tax=Bacillus TaxID=1386 RepID=UPI0004DD3FD5|nr:MULTISPECIES: hypothetical protein [unclassified Bacillus (in: firmicutes)]MBK5346110.1 hypothetical protein [Bacillus sp. TH45]MBK5360166.1 hypothetical protein [Bacillus sp. TH44]MBK5362214.1 hypothetical protein [Bacillus sp. TH50]QWI72707.1 hypothetical protein ER45_013575 [Bacillus mycoides]
MDSNYMMPLQVGETLPYMGRIVDVKRTETGVFVQVPADMLNNAGIANDTSKVEVWREMADGTICFRVLTKCELCGRGAKLYELDLGVAKRRICADDYFKLTGKTPPQDPVTTESAMQIEQP